MSRAPFLSLDGLDGAGKSTQCRLLAEWLREQGWNVTQCADPGGTVVGQSLRQILLDKSQRMSMTAETLLFMASRAQLVDEIIRPSLEAGNLVLSDRFLLANVVYQGHAGGMDPEKVRDLALFATAGLEPDLVVVLDLPKDLAKTRRTGKADRVESRDETYHERVRSGFLIEAKQRPDRIRVVDASASAEEVQSRIREAVRDFVNRFPHS
ncbi:MAG: dTMP kinase [Gemmataceae bacterium]|nr:dTMP kinase [Gemmataceae bacterium]